MTTTVVTADDVYAIFQQKGCGSGGCHGGAHPAQGLLLDSAATIESSLVNKPSSQCSDKQLIAPGDPAASYLINKLTGSGMCSGSQMPKGGSALNSAQLSTVRAFISSL